MAYEITFNRKTKDDSFIVEHWLVEDAQAVQKGQEIATVISDKRSYVIRSPFSGILIKKKIPIGEILKKGTVIAELLNLKEAGKLRIEDTLTSKDRRILDALTNIKNKPEELRKVIHVKATPRARKLAEENNLNLEMIVGSGPDGRIQESDVIAFINRKTIEDNQYKQRKKILYGLPLSPIAKRLAKRRGVDTTLVPAPPGAKKLRKRDIERYLKYGNKAEEEIEKEYGIVRVPDDFLKGPEMPLIEATETTGLLETTPVEEKKTVIRLSTEVPSISKNDEVIELPEKYKKALSLPSESQYFLLLEDKNGKADLSNVIKLYTEEPLKSVSLKPIELDNSLYKKELQDFLDSLTASDLLLPGPQNSVKLSYDKEYKGEPIKLFSEESLKEESGPVIELNEENQLNTEAAVKEPEEETEEMITINKADYENLLENLNDLSNQVKQLKQKPVRDGHLETIVNLDLIGVYKTFKPDVNMIGTYAKSFLLKEILEAYNKVTGKEAGGIYISDINEISPIKYSQGSVEEILDELEKNNQKPLFKAENEIAVVDLLPYDVTDVSGLINWDQRVIVYLSFLRDMSRFFVKDEEITSILVVNIDYDTSVMSSSEAVRLISLIRESIEKIGEKDGKDL